jgi:hypothetical protein
VLSTARTGTYTTIMHRSGESLRCAWVDEDVGGGPMRAVCWVCWCSYQSSAAPHTAAVFTVRRAGSQIVGFAVLFGQMLNLRRQVGPPLGMGLTRLDIRGVDEGAHQIALGRAKVVVCRPSSNQSQ